MKNKMKIVTFAESPEGIQLQAGELSDGHYLWHSDDHKTYWCGTYHRRTYQELYNDCQNIIKDLLKNHPDLSEQ